MRGRCQKYVPIAQTYSYNASINTRHLNWSNHFQLRRSIGSNEMCDLYTHTNLPILSHQNLFIFNVLFLRHRILNASPMLWRHHCRHERLVVDLLLIANSWDTSTSNASIKWRKKKKKPINFFLPFFVRPAVNFLFFFCFCHFVETMVNAQNDM